MAESALIDQAYHRIISTMVARGQSPHYTELGTHFGLKPEQGKQLLHDLLSTGIPAWVYPDTDYVSSFAPFNNLPTQYRISVDGQQRWFAQ